jgi:hypothetical protein
MDWKQYKSTALTYFFMTNRFENKSKIKAIVLKEIREMKMGCSFRTIVPVGMRFLKKLEIQRKSGGLKVTRAIAHTCVADFLI